MLMDADLNASINILHIGKYGSDALQPILWNTMGKVTIVVILQILDIPTNKNLLRSLTHKSYFSKIKRLRLNFDWAVLAAKKKANFPLDFHEPPKN